MRKLDLNVLSQTAYFFGFVFNLITAMDVLINKYSLRVLRRLYSFVIQNTDMPVFLPC